MALSNIHAIYGELQPYERRELVHLVIHRVELSASKLVLEINGGVCTVLGETPLMAHNGSLVCEGHRTGSPSWIRTNNMPVNSRPLYH